MTPHTRALLVALSPAALTGIDAAEPQSTAVAVTTAALLVSSALFVHPLSRVLALAGLSALALVLFEQVTSSPFVGLSFFLLGTWLALQVLGNAGRRRSASSAFGAAEGTFILWAGHVFFGDTAHVSLVWQLALSLAVSTAFVAAELIKARRQAGPGHPPWIGLRVLVLVACSVVSFLVVSDKLPVDAVAPCAMALIVLGAGGFTRERAAHFWSLIVVSPERLLVATFAALCLLGTFLLLLPHSAVERILPLDAAFTAVSAVCVTGLTVLDIGTQLTLQGQLVVLLLIQVGGLGIMTFSILVYAWVGGRMSLRQERALEDLLGTDGSSAIITATRRIMLVTFGSEAVGAGILTSAFLARGDTLGQALYSGVFTSISAFCNAGFGLHADNLMGYNRDPVVLHTVAILITLGGLSPAAIVGIAGLVRSRSNPRFLGYVLPLAVSLVLLAGGALAILAFEWDNTLRPFGIMDRVHNAWFQSATLRTAGFNSIDFAAMRPATLTLSMVFMFIGGSPGGTAGGIKTTALALVLGSVLRAVRGDSSLILFKRRVSERSQRRAFVSVTVATIVALGATVTLQLTQAMPPVTAAFEVFSALGTVGLTIGGTALLDEIGKVIIMSCMFIGRVGGLSLITFLSNRQKQGNLARPVEEVDVG